MFLSDCIWVCSFSTTSPSCSRSWVSLMPVISLKALASTLDSYSWVVRVSDTTLIFIPRNGSAALINHLSSSSCWSAGRVDCLNSLPIHFFAASSYASAQAVALKPLRASTAANEMLCRSLLFLFNIETSWLFIHGALAPTHHTQQPHQGQRGRHPDAPAGYADHQQMQVGAAEKTDKQAITTGGADRQQTAPRDTRRAQFPGGHARQNQGDAAKEQRGGGGPGHPFHHRLLRPGPGQSPWPRGCAQTRSPACRAGWSTPPPLPARPNRSPTPRRCGSSPPRWAWR